MPGHLFIVQGDLTRLACDAWLLPTGRGLQIRGIWLNNAPDEFTRLGSGAFGPRDNPNAHRLTWYFEGRLRTPAGWQDRSVRSFEIEEWPTEGDVARPWATQVVVDPSWGVDQIAERVTQGARQFVQHAAAALKERGKPAAFGRHRHLLALPVIATGHGGGWASAGAILRELVPLLIDEVRRIDADVALVTFTDDQFAAAHHARQKLVEGDGVEQHWSGLSPALMDTGRNLAARAVEGKLVLFVGAGVSKCAGLPDWQELLERLAGEAGFGDAEKQALKELPDVDQARLIQERLERVAPGQEPGRTLAEAICDQVETDRYGLTHALLGSLPVTAAVTANYDTLLERASSAAGYPTAILPYESTEGKRRWLLKMHGCVTQPNDIVLTREDFMRYAESRGALAAIVQAMLITHHMLFVGFSLRDDNFLRIADEVRKVMRRRSSDRLSSPRAFGTALLLNPTSLIQSLWREDIACVGIDGGQEHDLQTRMRIAASQLEVLLDYVLFESNKSVGHLLDDRYGHLLNDDEARLKQQVLNLQAAATPEMRSLPAWGHVADLLRKLGGRPG